MRGSRMRITRLEEELLELRCAQQRLEERQQRLEERLAGLKERTLRVEEELRDLRRTMAVIAHKFGVPLARQGFARQ